MKTDGGYMIRVSTILPTRFGPGGMLHLVAREDGTDPQVVLECREPQATRATVRIHSACFTGDVLGSVLCDCGPQLSQALDELASARWGVLVYAVDHEGRGIGLEQKLKAYNLQQAGHDTFVANRLLGHGDDLRTYTGAVAALRLLGVVELDLLSGNPQKARALSSAGLHVRSVRPVLTRVQPANRRYLEAKAERYRQMLDELVGVGVVGDVSRLA